MALSNRIERFARASTRRLTGRDRPACHGASAEPASACCTVLAIAELQKPARWACSHLACDHCGIYDQRPQSCRDFNCAWLKRRHRRGTNRFASRKQAGGCNSFDFFYSTVANRERFIAFELWNGAFADGALPRRGLVDVNCRRPRSRTLLPRRHMAHNRNDR